MKYLLVTLVLLLAESLTAAETSVHVIAPPATQSTLQPRVVVDDAGTAHLIYFSGDPAGGNIFYSCMKTGASQFSTPIHVNSEADSAVALGTIRGADLAVSTNGRV